MAVPGAAPAVMPILRPAALATTIPAVIAALVIAACAGTAQVPRAVPSDLVEVRLYAFDCPLAEPQPAWAPVGDRIAIRIANGFALLEEGRKRQEVFGASGSKDRQHPCWLDDKHLLLGSSANVIRLADGTMVPPGQGLELIELRDDGDTPRKEIDRWGYRPRVGGERRPVIVTQVEDRVRMVDPDKAKGEDFVDGFFAEPQPDGPGLAWTETPVVEPDHWIGRAGAGALVVRWKSEVVDRIPSALQPRWVPGGRGLVATRLRGPAPPTGPWWQPGTEVIWIPGPGQAPVVITDDGRDPAPHPTHPLVVVTAKTGLVVCALGGTQPAQPLKMSGSAPLWNAAGDRLLAVESFAERGQSRLNIVVLALRGASATPTGY